MTSEDREFIVRVLAAHLEASKLGSHFTAEQYRVFISDFANVHPPKPEQPKTVTLVDGRELPIRDRRAS